MGITWGRWGSEGWARGANDVEMWMLSPLREGVANREQPAGERSELLQIVIPSAGQLSTGEGWLSTLSGYMEPVS
jgi:hypothetical protein